LPELRKTHLLHNPALNRLQIVFSNADDLWTLGRDGGTAIQLSSGTGIETVPVCSPDGDRLAFIGELRAVPDPSGANSREITVERVASEAGLRNLAWVEDNRRRVDPLSGGKLAYVYMARYRRNGPDKLQSLFPRAD
jgi:hypothetical protein